MAFCANCGTQLAEGAKFCASCGTPAGGGAPATAKPDKVKDGVIHKCVNCGAVLPSMAAICPSCGYELRDMEVSGSIAELFQKLDSTKNGAKRSQLIKDFRIPNTKEALMEFMIEAHSRIVHGMALGIVSPGENTAWLNKFDQAYNRAKIVLTGDSATMRQIEGFMNDFSQKQKAGKKKLTSIVVIWLAVIVGLGAAVTWGVIALIRWLL